MVFVCLSGVWCPVCNQGFTRHYNLKVHMYKSHGKEYLENNFSQDELDSLMRPPPGSNTSKPSPSPRKVDKETAAAAAAAAGEIVIQGSPTGVLPISPPLTPKLSPKQRRSNDDSPTLVPGVRIIPAAATTAFLAARKPVSPRLHGRPGPASLTKPQHYFDEEAQHSMVKCQLCDTKFLRKSDLYIHLSDAHAVSVLACELCEDRFVEAAHLASHMSLVHGQHHHQLLKETSTTAAVPPRRRPGPASRTNAPKENRATPTAAPSTSPPQPTTTTTTTGASNLPSHLAAQYPDSPGYPCSQCGKVLMHKQSYVSHMRVIHGDYYGGNKWRGSSVVQMVLGDQETSGAGKSANSATALNNITNHPAAADSNGDVNAATAAAGTPSYNDFKFGQACEFCNKAFEDQKALDDHISSKHPFLTKRIQAFKAALGLNDSEEQPQTKRLKLDYEGTLYKDENENSLLPSYSILSISDAQYHTHLSVDGRRCLSPAALAAVSHNVGNTVIAADDNEQPLDLACKPVSVSVYDERDRDAVHHLYNHYDPVHPFAASHNSNGNNLLQVVDQQRPCPSPPSSPLNLHVSRPATPSPSPDPPAPPPPLSHADFHTQHPPTAPVSRHADNGGDMTSSVSPPTTSSFSSHSYPSSSSSPSSTSPPRTNEYLVKQSHATADESGRKKFLCPVCKCQLSWKTNLSVHLRTHSGERPFQCVLCHNRFRQKAHLYKHFRCSHGHKVAPYHCPFCPETFTRSPNDLYNHITEVHKHQTDHQPPQINGSIINSVATTNISNNNNSTASFSLKEPMKVETTSPDEPLSLVLPSVLTPPSESERSPPPPPTSAVPDDFKPVDVAASEDDEEIDVEAHDEEDDDDDDTGGEERVVNDRDDDIRFEPVTEAFLFEGQMIRPSYCVLPFVTDEEVEQYTSRNNEIAVIIFLFLFRYFACL